MPARDPVTSPHLPTTQPQSNTTPNSSAFSIRPQAQSPPPSAGSGAPAVDSSVESGASGGYFAQVLRRVSISGNAQRGTAGAGPMENHSFSPGQHDTPHADGSQQAHQPPRRKQSQDLDDRYGNIAASSQAIRESTHRLASLSFTPPTANRPRRISASSHDNASSSSSHFQPSFSPRASRDYHRPIHPSHLNPAVSSSSTNSSLGENDIGSPRSYVPGSVGNIGRSGLSVMMDREKAAKAAAGPATSPIKEDENGVDDVEATPRMPLNRVRLDSVSTQYDSTNTTPRARKSSLPDDTGDASENDSDPDDPNSSSALRRYLASEGAREDLERANERTPLIPNEYAYKKGGPTSRTISGMAQRMRKVTAKDVVHAVVEEPVKSLPSVILGLLLNVLDGVSYGMILFPASPVFQDFGSLGVSMFFMSCIVSQLVFSLGGSIFPGGNGSMMIEAVPFFHILVNIIQAEVGDDARAIVSTTMMAFAFSSILTGLVFFALGAFRLGALIGYFPRHILVGCIGGVGIFLIETGLEVSRGLKEEGFEYNLATLKLFFNTPHSILLWTIPLALAILLRIITHFYHHQLIFPAYFFIIPIIFYIVIAAGHWDFDHLRQTGWVFDVGKNTQAWWKFYTYFDFKATNWTAFWAAMPTQLALVFFGILHVPLNVPALGVSLCEDNVKLDRELVAHGFSNLAAGLTGTVPNYLTYVNTVLFYRVGGGSRLSGLMLAAATAAIMMVGPTVIGYLPVMVVGALIFVLGIDLTIEAVWDTRNRVNKMEYITIWAIAIGMTVWDFVIGLLFGIILACIFFVVQNSRRRAIRTVFNGATAKSTVRRPRSQRAFIQQVGSQTYVMKLQGFLFFGTISAVEEEIRKLLDMAKWQEDPIRFLIIDFHLVHGLDFSSAEAFVRVQRLLSAKDVLLILCGAAPNGLVESALQGVDLWADREGSRVEVFAGLNEALEWTENAYLTAFYDNQKAQESGHQVRVIDFPKVAKPPFSLAESFANSPRRTHLARVGGDTLPQSLLPPQPEEDDGQEEMNLHVQPLNILLLTFGSYANDPPSFFALLVPFFSQQVVNAGQTLWHQSDRPDGLYLIESGSLRATYNYDNHGRRVQETMVAGTIAGDLSTLSETQRNATVIVERDGVLWKLDAEGLERMENDRPEEARRFIKIVLKAVAEEQEVLSSHLIAMLS